MTGIASIDTTRYHKLKYVMISPHCFQYGVPLTVTEAKSNSNVIINFSITGLGFARPLIRTRHRFHNLPFRSLPLGPQTEYPAPVV